MCAPVLGIIGMVASVGSSLAQGAAAQADYEARSEQWRQNYVNALAAARDEQNQLTNRQLQEQSAYVQKRHLSLVEQAEKQSEAEVSAASAGVSGISVENLVQDIGRKAATNRAIAEQNWIMTANQLQAEKRATVTTAQNRINSVARPTSPSMGAYLLGAVGSGVKSFATM